MQHSFLRKIQAWQELMAQSSRDRATAAAAVHSMGPAILVSGFLTKKTRKMSRWKRRWWQLLDNGMLLYFKDDQRLKLLGEIDVGRTCYDVRLGSDRCKVSFPRVVPSCCCIAFSVLKRTYYVYAPTAAEAKRWAENLYNVSLVLNRRRAVNRKHAPTASAVPARAPSCPPSLHITRRRAKGQSSVGTVEEMSRLSELQDRATDLPVFQRNTSRARPLLTHHKLHSSVPSYLDQLTSPDSLSEGANPRMWLDGSPSPVFTTSTFKPGLKVPRPSSFREERQQQQQQQAVASPPGETHHQQQQQQALSSSYSQNVDSFHHMGISDDLGGGTVPRMGEKRKRVSLPSTFMSDFAKLEHKEAQIRKKLEKFDAPVRPASVTDYTQIKSSYTPQGRPRQHSLGGVPVLPTLMKRYSSADVLHSPKIPPPVMPKPSKSFKGGSKREPSFVTATRIIPMTASPTGLEDSTSIMTASVATICEEEDYQTTTFRPRKDSGPPNFVPPPPPSRSSSVSSSDVTSPSWVAQAARSSTAVTEANSCSDHELQKVLCCASVGVLFAAV